MGDAPIVVKQSIKDAPIRKEVRVYMPYAEDTTGLYLFIQNEIVLDFKLDEFNGIQYSSVMGFFESRWQKDIYKLNERYDYSNYDDCILFDPGIL